MLRSAQEKLRCPGVPAGVLKGFAVLLLPLGWIENHTYLVSSAKSSPAPADIILFVSGGKYV